MTRPRTSSIRRSGDPAIRRFAFRPSPSSRAFTLVELLVSMAVLTMLILLVTQLMNSATIVTTGSRKRMDADDAARLVFDRMAGDFANMLKRKDVNYIFCKQPITSGTNNDAMFFYSEAPAYFDTGASATARSSAALIGYRVHFNPDPTDSTNTKTIPQLERFSQVLTWDGLPITTGTSYSAGGMTFLTYSGSSSIPLAASTLAGQWPKMLASPPYLSGTNSDYFHVLSDQVFRMETCFLLKKGTYALSGTSVTTGTTGYSNAPTAISIGASKPQFVTSNYFNGTTSPDLAGNVYGFPPDLAGIVVTIALLDNTSRKILTGSQLAQIAATLTDSLSGSTTVGAVYSKPGVSSQPQLPAQAWQNTINASAFQGSFNPAIPRTALSQIRIYQRIFYFNTP